MPIAFLKNQTPVYTSKDCPLYVDSLLLAQFCAPKPAARVLELCAGNGAVSLALADSGFRGALTAVELQSEPLALFRRAVKHAGIDGFRLLQGDVRAFAESKKYDIVVCNPPYYPTESAPAATAARDLARRGATCAFADVARAARRNLKQRGKLAICVPAPQLAQAIMELQQHELAVKRLGLCYHNRSATEPWLALLDARYRGNPGGLRYETFYNEDLE